MTDEFVDSDPAEATYFARAGRASVDVLAAQVKRSLEDPCFKAVLDAVNGYVVILDEHRQILGANQTLLDALQADSPENIVGLRVGEALNCIHFTEGTDGCGTSKHCRTCGAVLSILTAQAHGHPAESQCRLTVYRGTHREALDFQVRATPLPVAGASLTVVVFHDISALKRREVLEQVFFHDFLNALGGIAGWTEVLHQADPVTVAREIAALAEGLKEEVVAQRSLLEAERGELKVQHVEFESAELLAKLQLVFEHHEVAAGKTLTILPLPERRRIAADPVLLLRVLVNMVKNAFEATADAGEVRVWLEWDGNVPSFVVQNASVIPVEVREHIFERSFSTRAPHGRGIGTYSMRLYGENYLRGTVSYTSDATNGTRFRIALPAQASLEPHAPVSSAPATAGGQHVLLVDDNEPVLRLGTLLLTRLGYTVHPCHSGREALEAFTKAPESFAAIVTDWRMPGLCGPELLQAFEAVNSAVPVIVCSGLADSDLADAGAHAHLNKPFTFQELRATLQQVLGPSMRPAA